jgi:hypothetical protein
MKTYYATIEAIEEIDLPIEFVKIITMYKDTEINVNGNHEYHLVSSNRKILEKCLEYLGYPDTDELIGSEITIFA